MGTANKFHTLARCVLASRSRKEVNQVMAGEDREEMRAEYTETTPGDDCRVIQAQTSPYVLATVKAQDEHFTFERAEERRSC